MPQSRSTTVGKFRLIHYHRPIELRGKEADMQGIEGDDSEMAYRRGYEHG
jgi:hypothetical protein